MCEDSASFDITSGDIAQCIGDVDHILKLKLDMNLYATQEEGVVAEMLMSCYGYCIILPSVLPWLHACSGYSLLWLGGVVMVTVCIPRGRRGH